jgi:hypothetical protein
MTASTFIAALGHQVDIPVIETAPDGKGIILKHERSYIVQWDEQEREQLLVNRAFAVMGYAFTLRLAKRLAAERHAHLPQYAGHWSGDEWRLVRFVQRVEGKGGISFEPGDISIGKVDYGRLSSYSPYTAYSLRRVVNCSVPHFDFAVR